MTYMPKRRKTTFNMTAAAIFYCRNWCFGHMNYVCNFAFDSTSAVQLAHTSAKMAPRCSQKTMFDMASARHLEFAKFRFFLSNMHPLNRNLHLRTKFDRNQIHGWDMEIKLFSKRRPSVILNLRKLPFWSRDLCLRVILPLRSKFPIDRPIWRDAEI